MCKVWNCLAVPRLRFDGATGTRLPFRDIYAETIAVVCTYCVSNGSLADTEAVLRAIQTRPWTKYHGICFSLSSNCRKVWGLSSFDMLDPSSSYFIISGFFDTCHKDGPLEHSTSCQTSRASADFKGKAEWSTTACGRRSILRPRCAPPSVPRFVHSPREESRFPRDWACAWSG